MDDYKRAHWSTLLYVETRAVDHSGRIDPQHVNETDVEAMDDMERDGLIFNRATGVNRRYALTDLGWCVAAALRRRRAERLAGVEVETEAEVARNAAAKSTDLTAP